MKRFRGFVIKEFYHIFRDYRSLLILFGMPFAQILLFGFVITNEIKDAQIAIYDQSKDHQTRRITDKLLSSGYFKLEREIESYGQIEESFQKGETKLVIVFEKGFATKLEKENRADMQIITDASDPNTANILLNYTQGIVNTYLREMNPTARLPHVVEARPRMLYNPGLEGVYMFVPGTMALLLMLISAMMTSISISKEKEMGTMEVLLVSPLKPVQIIVGKVIPYLFLSLINALTIILLAKFVFDVPISGNFMLLLGESMLFIFMALSLGILISTVAPNQQIAMMLSMFALMLPTMLLSGFIFPIENMPVILQYLAQVMPAKWFIIIIKNIMLKGLGMGYIWKETLIITGFTLLFIALSIKKFKTRLE